MDTGIKIGNVEETSKRVKEFKLQGLKVGYIEGVWDVFHIGHLQFIEFSKKQCDKLLVVIASDAYARTNKGPDRPIFKQFERGRVVAGIADVDLVCLEDNPPAKWNSKAYEDYISFAMQELSPDFMIVSMATDVNPEIKENRAKKIGVKFIRFNEPPPSSSTEIIRKLEANYPHGDKS